MKSVIRNGPVLKQLLDACKSSKFVTLDLENDTVKKFHLTPIGKMLKNNLREEFYRGESGTELYEGSSELSLMENLRFAQETFAVSLPFGMAVEDRFTGRNIQLSETHQMELERGSLLTCSYFINPATSKEFMYKAQRQRKIWWMRFACDPGRYFISDPRQDSARRIQSVNIRARFGDEELTLEQLELIPGDAMWEQMRGFQAKAGRSGKKITPDVVRISQCAEVATLGVILDAAQSSEENSVKIHRRLAPFKCGIVCMTEDPIQLEELRDLARHLTTVIRRVNLAVLDCSRQTTGTSNQRSLTKQLHHLDSIGVPYSLLLREQSLQNGLLQLRSRDTTISETIHISDLPHYLLKIITS
ncbi:DNA polymerase subunit gamma-2, mitochondrial [Toxorhynchites rutilus septentrionalis]|uniref:DNA polymerase subunit gamma-2, mitochondrial n=1 Tax=Toxorhynchites rutilus septentrionalis TaxID=329112 RepID=UPI00247A3CD5|nr:DNA polymerase subunit gamma-2, mitochondrial [Toxorhynchites rutilus septentrionalis]